ncbi:hypothetical protein OG800_49645 (plasmid) [Streptomyces sp. NBC_00445]|uniref:hypothetical protein n=1 Tax=Streptomyces sp. NBC_00445 TaxID=2975745 RepID=UPI002E244B2D
MRAPFFHRRRRRTTPAEAITQALRRQGLRPGIGGDFTITTVYRQVGVRGDKERLWVSLNTRRARERVKAHRDDIERDCARTGWPFYVRSRPGNGPHLENNLTTMPAR